MPIERLELVPYALRFREPYVTARGRLERRELLLVRLWTDDGLVGLGEAAPLALRGGASLGELASELESYGVDSIGTEEDLSRRPLYERTELSAPARSALDIAHRDLVGKMRGEPAYRSLLGSDDVEPVLCNATLSTGPPADVARSAERWAGRGFTSFKLKLGAGEDVAQVEAVRSALGAEARIRIDANASWSVDEAADVLRRLEPFEVEFAEQPVSTLEQMVELRSRTSIPIAADEAVVTRDDARRARELGACELAAVKLAKCGGMPAALDLGLELPVYLSSALDGPVGIAAAAHAAVALDRSPQTAGVAHGLATSLLFEDTIASRECALDGPLLRLPEGPGLGVEIDEAALERHRL